LLAVPVHADDAPDEITVRGQKVLLPKGELDATLPASVLRGDDLRLRHATVDEALTELPGARVQRLGGFGAPAWLTLRASGADQIAAFVDGVPLVSLDGAWLDLGDLAPGTIERIDVYRGCTPGGLGLHAIGGALHVRLRAPREPLAEITTGGGSFGARLAEAAVGGAVGGAGVTAALRWLASDGDHPYVHDGGTAFDPSDDGTLRRQNNALQRLGGMVALRTDLGAWNLDARWLGSALEQGVPGPVRLETEQAAMATERQHAWLQAARSVWGGRVQATAQSSWNHSTIDDRLGELGLPWHARRTVTAGLAQLAWQGPLWGPAGLQLRTSLHHGSRTAVDLRTAEPEPPSSRTTLGLAIALPVANEARTVELQPSASIERQHSELMTNVGPPFTWRAVPDADRTLTGARLGAGWRPRKWLQVTGSLQRGVRAPSLVELFGEGATIRPNPALRPESALGVDGGVTLRGSFRRGNGVLQANAFAQDVTDLVQLHTISPHQALYQNVAGATVRGLELAAAAEWGRQWLLAGHHTSLVARDATGRPAYDGKALPLWPRTRWQGRLEWRRPLANVTWRAWTGVVWQAGWFLDPANLVAVPARTVASAGVRADHERSGLWFDFAVDDLNDAARVDLIGWPLPGRTVMARLGWHAGGHSDTESTAARAAL
jgi:iron complex outermembrane receptor protein